MIPPQAVDVSHLGRTRGLEFPAEQVEEGRWRTRDQTEELKVTCIHISCEDETEFESIQNPERRVRVEVSESSMLTLEFD